ncbi:MAG: hypothetical protein Q8R76_01750 [Candidatus Omnitrophota bacterium]|nr:hypothetical protein [Candidatus Omnitrophota bacterium]
MALEGEFGKEVNELIRILKKLLKHTVKDEKWVKMESHTSDKGLNINIFLHPMILLNAQDFESLDEAYDKYLFDKGMKDDLPGELSPEDLDFLSQNGIEY